MVHISWYAVWKRVSGLAIFRKDTQLFLANRKVNDWRLKKSTLWFV